MGNSDKVIIPFYKKTVLPNGKTALLGFVNNNIFKGDLYDIALENWDINSDWKLNSRYDTIICTRCSYFCKDLSSFFDKCHSHLNIGGILYVDCGLGDHYRFKKFKVGWVKDGEHEWGHFEGNYLWSTMWCKDFEINSQYINFEKLIKKLNYDNLKSAVFQECPTVFDVDLLNKFYLTNYDVLINESPLFLLNIMKFGKKS